MSRKHYIEVAQVIRDRIDDGVTVKHLKALHAVACIAEELADMFKRDNSNFDRSRFMDACGLTSEGN